MIIIKLLPRNLLKNRVQLLRKQQYQLLDHKKIEQIKHNLFTDGQKTMMLKTKFMLKQAKYTMVQGSKDLWNDVTWMINLYKNKHKNDFTGFELAESHRVIIDMLKFVPYFILVIIPFAELFIPFVLWFFPNAIPSFYLFDTAQDQRLQRYEQVQFQSHKFLIQKLANVMRTRFKLSSIDFTTYEFFKEGYFQIIDQLDKYLHYQTFTSDQLIKVLQFLGGGDFVTGTVFLNKVINLCTLIIPRIILKLCRGVISKIFGIELKPYQDPWFIKGDFRLFQFNYFPFEFFKKQFLLIQIKRKFKMIGKQDRAFQKFGIEDVIGNHIKSVARERGLATLSCYQTLKNVVRNDWVKFTTHPKFKNSNTKLWYSVMMYNFLKQASREIN